MILKHGDRVRSKSGGHEGRVDMVSGGAVRVQFDHGRIGIFDQENDNRLELVDAPNLLALASAANEAAIAYREIAEKYTSYTGQREACEKLLRAVDALTSAVVEAENNK